MAHVPVAVTPQVVVEDPTPSVHYSERRKNWQGILDQVRAAGGRWCRVGEYDKKNHATVTMAWLKRYSKVGNGFEFCTRVVRVDGVKRQRLYARLANAEPTPGPAAADA